MKATDWDVENWGWSDIARRGRGLSTSMAICSTCSKTKSSALRKSIQIVFADIDCDEMYNRRETQNGL